MSDPRNVAHAKKVTQEKKHHGVQGTDGLAAQPGKKPARKKNVAPVPDNTAPAESAAPAEKTAAPKPPAALEGSLTVLAQLRDMEFHSRANIERLAGLTLTVEEELKQKQFGNQLGEVYSAQDNFQSKLTALIEAYKAECDRMQSENA